MARTENEAVLDWVNEMAALTTPDNVVWIDGSEAQLEALRAEAVGTGELEKLNEARLPGCYLHRTAQNDVARVEDRTFICCRREEDAGPTNNWMEPQAMYAKLKPLYKDAMRG
ncbi:MAG: phosphoenolpyruvate carboxykinase, partial [Clostridiales bacterium]|nr:phosphoenolpyruvate carboxykinase [Clostridiales bacterium]